MTCHITGSVVIPDGTSAANRKITLRKEEFTIQANGELAILPEYITVYTDATGNVSFDLMPGTYSGFYVTPPDGRIPFRLSVPNRNFANFASLIVTTSVTTDQGLIDLMNDAYDAIRNPSGGGASTWGSITGTLSSQTDLQAALDGKANTDHTQAFSTLTAKPTTLAGYGITDALQTPHIPALSGHWMQPPQVGGLGSGTNTAGRIQLFPLVIPNDLTISQAALVVGGAVAGSTAKILIYGSNANLRAEGLLYESGVIDCSTTGAKLQTLGSPIAVTKGQVIWLGTWMGTISPNLNHMGSAGWAIPSIRGDQFPVRGANRVVAFGGVAPDPWGWADADHAISNIPLVIVRAQ